MGWLLTVYWFCFGAGLLYVLAAGLLGAFSHGMHALGGHDAGGGSGEGAGGDADAADSAGIEAADLDGHEGGADSHAGAASQHIATHDGIDYSPLSPLSVAGTLCGFGAGGLIASGLGWTQSLGLLGALGGGAVSSLLLWLVVGKLLYSMQASSEGHVADLIGLEAEVLTPLTPGATGEVAYILDGSRYTAPARMHGEGSAALHDTVRIRRMEDNVVYVERKRKLLE